ncbi:MAG: hypothetical protein M0T84_10550 [Betaproteobacteria bacterium]|nr:hypothetical protein [Betaproteobacteria bacterium]
MRGIHASPDPRLAPLVREKAMEIANALLAEGADEGKAIRIAIAKEGAEHRGLPTRDNDTWR